ncbi:MAG: UDP-N-acetylmuramate--L-alanine ligase, partial [Clostridia bacterium]|nr:UDP-N-acetylmuramate--L-alanine ligase [Clostridia bacterium]
KGVARRYETVGYFDGCRIISDYAHHPSEIKAVISTAKKENERVIAIFEPHTYSRTASLLKEFAGAFSSADTVIILPTYSARETPSDGVNSERLFCELEHKEKYFISSYEQCVTLIKNLAKDNGIVLLLGAGSIDCMRDMLVKNANSDY